jgi:hypothetical protein
MAGFRQEYLNRSSAAMAGRQCHPRSGPHVAKLGEEVAAHQSLRRFLEEDAGVPTVGRVRRVDIAGALAAAVDAMVRAIEGAK